MINYDLKIIKAIVFDIDGVLSCSTVGMDETGVPIRTLNVKDGYAIQLAQEVGLNIGIITGGGTDDIKRRYESLGVRDIYMNSSVKIHAWNDFLHKYHLSPDEVIYVGDDIPDFQIMQGIRCACCPKDASSDIKSVALYISDVKGGYGVGRDIIEQVLRSQGRWFHDVRVFGW